VFALNGTAAKTRDIARAANVTEAVLYRHFRSKDEIFAEAVLFPLDQLATELLRLTMQLGAAREGHRRWELSQEIQREIFAVMEKITPLIGIALLSETGRAFHAGRVGPLVQLATESMSRSLSPAKQEQIRPETVFVLIAGMYFGICIDAMLGGAELDREQITKELVKLVAFGIRRAREETLPERSAKAG
jgi:AcrR family transcriptional regulator